MSYARFGWDGSDVYVFLNVAGYFSCCGCQLIEREYVESKDYILGFYLKPINEEEASKPESFYSTKEIIDHLEEHKKAGHYVPDSCIERILEEEEENDKWIKNWDKL